LNIRFYISLFLLMAGVALPAHAVDSNALLQLKMEAGNRALAGDYQGAIRLYDQILSIDNASGDVYVQRALMYRELGDVTKSMSDAAIALDLINRKFAEGAQKASLYHQRANAQRLLRKFPEAKQDMETAIQMSRSNKWTPDLQAIYLEEKIYVNK
jgi:tetratricopeptide (TPR) repeat protein